jgi:tetratricopeptide (TPR) repeat protein/O-antigen ligase
MARLITHLLSVGLFFIPFLLVPGIEEYTLLPRLLLLQLLLILILSIAAFRPSLLRLGNPGWDRLFLTGFICLLAASALWAANPFRSTYDLAKYVTLAAFYLVIAGSPKERLHALLTVHAISGLAVALVGILEYHGFIPLWIPSTGRPSSFFGYRNLAAAYMACGAPLSAVLVCTGTTAARRTLGAVSAAAMVVLMVYTRARASWVGLGLGTIGACVLALSVLGPRKFLAQARATVSVDRYRPIALATAIVATLSFLPEGFTETHIQRFDERKTDVATTVSSIFRPGGDRGRLHMWGSTLKMIADAPILGVGLGNWEFAYVLYDGGKMIEPRFNPLRPHNDLIWIWSETGTVGIALFVGFIVCLASRAFRRWRNGSDSEAFVTILLMASILSYIGVGLFTFPWERIAPSVLFWLSAGWVSSGEASHRAEHPWIARALLAVLILAFVITVQNTLFDWHYVRARVAQMQKQTEDMLTHATNALAYGTFDHQAHIIRGEALLALGRHDQARNAYSRTLDYHANFPNAHIGIGLVAYGQGDTTEAIRQYQEALQLNPDDYSAQYNLGTVFQELGKRDAAIALYRAAYHPNRPGAYVNLGTIYREMGLPDSAANVWQKAANALTPAPAALVNLGNLRVETGDFDEAIDLYTSFLQTSGTDPAYHAPARAALANAFVRRGLSSEHAGNRQGAFDDYHKAVELEPTIALHWYNLGNGYRALGQQSKAIESYLKALQLDQGHIDSYNNLGLAYLDEGRTTDAIAAYAKAIELDSTHAIVNYNLGNAYLADHAVDNARAAYARFEQNWSGDPALLHYYMAPVHIELGDTVRAREAAHSFLQNWEGDDTYRSVIRNILDRLER